MAISSATEILVTKFRESGLAYRLSSGIPAWSLLSLRSMRGLAATNTLYVISANEAMTIDEQAAWALSLLSSESPSGPRHAQVLSGWTRKVRTTRHLRLRPPKRITRSREAYHRAVTLLLSGDAAAATAIADVSSYVAPKKPQGEGRYCLICRKQQWRNCREQSPEPTP